MQRLPNPGDPRRDLFEIEDLVEMTIARKFVSFSDAVRSGRRFISETKGARAVHSICMRADGNVWLVRIGARGGWRKVWAFGDPYRA